jgi:Mg2+ and Co2+ transporter CorA
MEMDKKSLESTINALRSPSLRQIAGTQSTLDSQIWQDILHDYEPLLEGAIRNSHAFEAYEARCMNRFDLTASTISVSQVESVGRINILAFIFVPLSFITSFFGMNIVESGSGSVNL